MDYARSIIPDCSVTRGCVPYFYEENLDKSEIGRLCLRWWAMFFTDVQNILKEQHAMLSQQPRSAISEHNDTQRTTYGNDLGFDASLTDEEAISCSCCGRPVYEGEGMLESDDLELAHYGYRWAEGHESRFTLGICALDPQGENLAGLAVVTARSDGEQLIYTVLEPEQSPWGDNEALGKVLTRRQLLEV